MPPRTLTMEERYKLVRTGVDKLHQYIQCPVKREAFALVQGLFAIHSEGLPQEGCPESEPLPKPKNYCGRKSGYDLAKVEGARQRLRSGDMLKDVSASLGVTAPTLKRWLAEAGQ